MKDKITIKDLETRLKNAEKINGFCKFNIIHEDGINEGVWAVCCTKEDKKIYEANTRGDLFEVYLANHALIGAPSWGLKFKVESNGENRPWIKIETMLEQIEAQALPPSYKKELTDILGG